MPVSASKRCAFTGKSTVYCRPCQVVQLLALPGQRGNGVALTSQLAEATKLARSRSCEARPWQEDARALVAGRRCARVSWLN